MGQCPNCHEWNTFVETVVARQAPTGKSFGNSMNSTSSTAPIRTASLSALSEVISHAPKRISSNIKEFDRVLGGGFVPGQVTLLAGDPGIGKSTLLTQISKSMTNSKIIYVCGEESVEQIKVRAERMDYSAKNLLVLAETDVDIISASIENEAEKYKTNNAINRASGAKAARGAKVEKNVGDAKDFPLSLIIIDSIQTLYSQDLTGMAGSVGQVRGSTQKLTNVAKELSIPLILVGHVTKEGTVAGPKVLEHIVDTVLYLEGDSQNLFRILKTTKNRFGPISEVGIFEMSEEGMSEVENPSKIFLDQKLKDANGSCVSVVMEGFRPLLFEIQALTVKTNFGYPKRTASGFNVNRLQVLIAILEKRCGLNLSNYDVYLNVAGGFKISEHACDLAVCLAIASSIKEKSIPSNTAVFGECGLAGEIRQVTHQQIRIKEAKKLGYTNVISPERVRSLREALNLALK